MEHLAPLGFAFLLPYLPFWGILLCCGLAVAHALVVSPRWIAVTTRPEETIYGWSRGKLYYALGVTLLVLVFPARLELAAAAWAQLAAGDAASNLAGRRWGGRKFPGGGEKTWVGFLAFVGTGMPAAAVLLWWNGAGNRELDWAGILVVAFLAAVAGAFAEVLDAPVDDNLRIPWVVGFVLALWCGGGTPGPPADVSPAAAALGNLALAVFALALGWLSTGGVAAAVLVGFLVAYGLGSVAFLLLLLFLVAGSVLAKLREGRRRSAVRKPIRRVASVLGKGAWPGILGAVAIGGVNLPLQAAFLGAVGAALADTVATEVGQWRGKTFYSLRGGRVEAGSPGAVSVVGTGASVVAAAGLAILAAALRWVPPPVALVGAGAAVAAALWESWVGTGRSGSHSERSEGVLNFFTTLMGASLAWLGTSWIV
ncbi:MAG: hypothetical protein Kow00109_00520 [Acidobacteriota bacterium]